MSINVQISNDLARLVISGRFDSSVYPEFKQAYQPLMENTAIKLIEADISGVEYLDSGALGMLIQLNEASKTARKTLSLISVPGRASDILKVANADKLFTIKLPTGVRLDLHN